MLGDFNEIKGNEEKEGGILRPEASFSLFRSMISISGLHDLKTIGGFHTWIGNRSHYQIRSKIDRAMASCDWLDLYPTAHVRLLPWIGSDHKPLLLSTDDIKYHKRSLFKYDNRWRFEPQVKKVIQEVWTNECMNIPPEAFYKVIERCRNALSKWKSQNHVNTEKRINALKEQIQALYQSPNVDYGALNMLKAELSLQYRMEEEYWRTKSRIHWLQAGDRNNKFFHSKTMQRRSYNRIIHLTSEVGCIYTDPGDIQSEIKAYFQKIYATEGCDIATDLIQGIPRVITEEINKQLTKEVTEHEIEEAVFGINPDKSPGPDGMNAGFFRYHWDVIKQDDSLVFCRATVEECRALREVLAIYQKASGQAVNYAKSAITFSKGILKEITTYMRRFWWSSDKDKNKIAWISWRKITRSKRDGGLGIRDLEDFNMALLAKQGWRLLKHPQSLLARVFKAKYYRHTGFLEARSYSTSSYGWRSIIQTQDLLRKGVKWVVGNGKDISVWKDQWLGSKPATSATSTSPIHCPQLRVCELFTENTTEWNVQLIKNLFNDQEASNILRIRPSLLHKPDIIIWSYTKDGHYSVKSGYHLQRQVTSQEAQQDSEAIETPEEVKKICSEMWKLNLPPKVKTFWWRVAHNSLSVADNLKKRGIKTDDWCQVCGEEKETLNHMMFQCRVSKEIWSLAPTTFKHILQVIHGALRDCQQWREALQLANQNTQPDRERISKTTTIQEVLPCSASMYCLIDASWVNEKEVGGIGWSLYSKEGVHKLHASSSIKPTNSPLEAEACSLLMAVQEVRKLRYKRVAFMTDCKQLRDELHQQMTEQTIFKVRNTEASSMIRDIVAMAKEFSFTFHYVPRALIRNVDVMAKEARQGQRNYVISWQF